jgi:hypothetical protein
VAGLALRRLGHVRPWCDAQKETFQDLPGQVFRYEATLVYQELRETEKRADYEV